MLGERCPRSKPTGCVSSLRFNDGLTSGPKLAVGDGTWSLTMHCGHAHEQGPLVLDDVVGVAEVLTGADDDRVESQVVGSGDASQLGLTDHQVLSRGRQTTRHHQPADEGADASVKPALFS